MKKQTAKSTKDFHVRVIENERLLPTIQTVDIGFDEYLNDYIHNSDLPDSDRIMICQRKGIKPEQCLN